MEELTPGPSVEHTQATPLEEVSASSRAASAVTEDPSDTIEVPGAVPAQVDGIGQSARRRRRTARSDPNVGLILGEQYRLDRPVGHGGTGRVYVATQLSLGRSVAIKLLRPELDTESAGDQFAERFFREASLAGGLSHPNIVTIHDYGRDDDGTCFIAMELVEGRSLKDLMKAGPLDPERALDLFTQIARGLRHAHRSGLVHRDVKPGNVQITPGDDGGEVAKLLDFGLVKSDMPEVTEITREGSFLGTPHYASPEQVRGQEADARSDLYALGVMMYRAFTGVLPYYSRNSMALAMAHVRDPYPMMAERAPGVRVEAEHEAIVERLMQKDAASRYPSADALLLDLERALDRVRRGVAGSQMMPGRLAQAPTPAAVSRVSESRPFPKGPLAVGALLLMLTAGAAGVWWDSRTNVPAPVPNVVADVPPPADWSAEVLVDEKPLAIQVSLASEPSQAEIRVDGEVVGHTPWVGSLAVEDGLHQRLELRHPGFESQVVVLDPVDGQAAETVRLQPVKAKAPTRKATPTPKTAGAMPSAAPNARPAETSTAQPPPKSASPTPSAPGGAPVTVEGVPFSAAQAQHTLEMANSGTKESFLAAGIRTQEFNRVLAARPLGSLSELAAAPGVGPKTLQRMRDSAP